LYDLSDFRRNDGGHLFSGFLHDQRRYDVPVACGRTAYRLAVIAIHIGRCVQTKKIPLANHGDKLV
jgi:hypothetical protein